MTEPSAAIPDLVRIGDTTLAEAAQAMLRQVVWANALFKQHQRQAWLDVGRAFPGTGGEWLGEASRALAELTVQELTVSFALEERRSGLLARVGRFLRRLLGRAEIPTGRVYRFARPGAKDPIHVRLHVTHGPGGRFTVRSEMQPPEAAALVG